MIEVRHNTKRPLAVAVAMGSVQVSNNPNSTALLWNTNLVIQFVRPARIHERYLEHKPHINRYHLLFHVACHLTCMQFGIRRSGKSFIWARKREEGDKGKEDGRPTTPLPLPLPPPLKTAITICGRNICCYIVFFVLYYLLEFHDAFLGDVF